MVVDVNVLTSGWTIAGVIASFLVAVVALGLGASSFIQTKNLQKKERRERLLKEIIDWAIDICRCGLKPFPIPTSKMAGSKAGVELYLTSILADLLLEYESIYGKTEYICITALSFDYNLQNTVYSLAEIIRGRIKLLEKQMDILSGKRSDISYMSELAETNEFKEWVSSKDWPKGLSNSFKVIMYTIMMNRTILLDNAKQVIEEASKIKTKDIG